MVILSIAHSSKTYQINLYSAFCQGIPQVIAIMHFFLLSFGVKELNFGVSEIEILSLTFLH